MPDTGVRDAVAPDARGENEACITVGENDHPALSAEGLGDALLALFDKLVRGLPPDSVRALVENVLEDARPGADAANTVKNLFVMAFQTRWCRGGKAERLLFYTFLQVLYARFPSAVLGLVHLVPKYGYWKDLLALLTECPLGSPVGVDYSALHAGVWSLFAEQLATDWAELQCAEKANRTPKLSLCAKYAPSEGGTHSRAMQADRRICEHMFQDAKAAAGDVSWPHVGAKYRRMLTRLRKELSVLETFMCANRWAEIEFSSVPSLCMDRQKRAFLNENKKGEIAHPDAPSRRDCRERLLAHIVDKGVAALKGKQLFPHELVAQVCHFTAEPPLWGWMCSVPLSLSCVPGDQCERRAPVSRRVGGARCAVGGCAQRAARASRGAAAGAGAGRSPRRLRRRAPGRKCRMP